MRQVVLDTETTGLDPARGHRIVEIGCIELLERRRTGREFQRYLNPERTMDFGAAEVTGLTDEFLRDKPLFRQVVEEFMAFIDGAELIIHNAAFDLGFLNAELGLLGAQYGRIVDRCSVLDTLALAREKYPGQKNSLDALCKRLQVDSSHRRLHGALLDANLLTDVYLHLTAGQGDLGFEVAEVVRNVQSTAQVVRPLSRLRVVRADAVDNEMHLQRLRQLDKASKGSCLWLAWNPEAKVLA
jgi:DNA polymerase III subunit epsilon